MYVRLQPVDTTQSLRIFQWNVWGSRHGVSRIAAVVAGQKPDVICLNEPKYSRREIEFPDYTKYLGGKWYQSGERNVLLLSRFPIRQIQTLHDLGSDGLFFSLETEPPLSLFVVDVAANTEVFRRKVFEFFRKDLQQKSVFPEIILGDLNTPVQSFSIQSTLGEWYKDSYEIAGAGLGYTWPVWIPMMRIDSILVRHPDRVLRHQSGSSFLSDHLWEWIDYRKKEN
jgi:endonuclease/exonuclease/phosphatase family metal-dependent hydrolase